MARTTIMWVMASRLFLALLASAVLWAQTAPQTPPQQTSPIQVQVNEVIVPVTVTDSKGRFVSNLDIGDFRILEDGKEQKIAYFNREHNQPVVMGFLLDLSNRSRMHWKTFQDAAMELVWNLLSDDRQNRYAGFLVTYSNEAELAVDTTTDPQKITDRIQKLKPGGGSALFDGIYLACTRHKLVLGEPLEPRRVLVIVGDGNDNASKHSLDQVVEIAQRNLVTVYVVSTVAYGFASEGDAIMRQLAEETGGRVVYPLENLYSDVQGYLSTPSDDGNYAMKVGTGGYAAQVAKGIFNAIANVAGEVTTQYILRYTPANTDVGRDFRNVKVEVPSLPDVKVRARRGYYPAAP
jgi:Ca-activated chloride channel homolog